MKKKRRANPVVVAMTRRYGTSSTSHSGVRRPHDARNHWLADEADEDDDPQDCPVFCDGDTPLLETQGLETVTSWST